MIRRFFSIRLQPAELDFIILVIRIVVGIAFVIAGWGKIQHPTTWMPKPMAFPAVFQLLAAVSEFCGGIALILGLLTRLGAFGIACTMTVAVYMHRFVFGDPFVNMTGGSSYQLAAVYGLIAILILIYGPGRYSVDRYLFGSASKIQA